MREVKYCEKCGEKLDTETGLCPVCDFDTLERVVRTRNPIAKLMPAIYMTLFIMLCIVIINARTNGAGYDKFINDTMDNYLSNNIEWIHDNASAVFTYANNITEDKIDEYISSRIGDMAQKINEYIGEKGYDISYKVLSITDFTEDAISEYNLHNSDSKTEITKVKQANIEVNAHKGDKDFTSELILRISYEKNKWKVLYLNTKSMNGT